MKIGIDMRPLVWPGIGRYTFELARNLVRIGPDNEYVLFYRSEEQFRRHAVEGSNVRQLFVPFDIYSPLEHPWFFYRVWRERLDVFHSPSSLNVPALLHCRRAVTLHDIMFKERPDLVPSRIAALYFNTMNWWALQSADRLLCISEFTRDRLSAHYPQHARKALIAYNGVTEEMCPVTDPEAIRRMKNDCGIADDYILYVGTYKRHKNLPALVRAYAALPPELRERCQLVFVRKQYRDRPEVGQFMDELGVTPRFVPLESVPDDLMTALYSGASACVFPSNYEGFGLPLVEAMACGAPVVATDIAPFRETTGGRIPLVDPKDVTAMKNAIERLLVDEAWAGKIRAAGLERAALFTWENTARTALKSDMDLFSLRK